MDHIGGNVEKPQNGKGVNKTVSKTVNKTARAQILSWHVTTKAYQAVLAGLDWLGSIYAAVENRLNQLKQPDKIKKTNWNYTEWHYFDNNDDN